MNAGDSPCAQPRRRLSRPRGTPRELVYETGHALLGAEKWGQEWKRPRPITPDVFCPNSWSESSDSRGSESDLRLTGLSGIGTLAKTTQWLRLQASWHGAGASAAGTGVAAAAATVSASS